MATFGHQGGYAFNDDQRGGGSPSKTLADFVAIVEAEVVVRDAESKEDAEFKAACLLGAGQVTHGQGAVSLIRQRVVKCELRTCP